MKKFIVLLSIVFVVGCATGKEVQKEDTEIYDKPVIIGKIVPEDLAYEKPFIVGKIVPEVAVPAYVSFPEACNFAFDSKEPTLDDKKIATIIEEFKKYPDTLVFVEGHTDNVGPEWYNNKLSFERARAVVKILITKGVSEEKIIVQAAGFTKPIASNDTREGRARNRRVDIVLSR